MSNIVYVKTPTFVVTANGKLADAVRPDATKGHRSLSVQTTNFDSLKSALAWINKESQKKSTMLYLYEIRPSVSGTYNVRSAVDTIRKVAPKAKASASLPAQKTQNPSANTISRRTTSATAKTATKPANNKAKTNRKSN